MKKALMSLLTLLLLLILAAFPVYADNPEDYPCPSCGNPCDGWFDYISVYGVDVHVPMCSSCLVADYSNEQICTELPGSATCTRSPRCSKCGGEISTLPVDPDAHKISPWLPAGDNQHVRGCLYRCGMSLEFSDHSGGKATCLEPAVCEVCGGSYGTIDMDAHIWGDWIPDGLGAHVRTCERDDSHTEEAPCSWSDWTLIDDVYHERICSDCGAHDLREHIGGTATCTDPKVCEECGGKYGTIDMDAHIWGGWVPNSLGVHVRTCERDDSHTEEAPCSWSDWSQIDDVYHGRSCSDCGALDQREHIGGTATCLEPAVCEVCGESYGTIDMDAHIWGDWISDGLGVHVRTCERDDSHTEEAPCSWSDWTLMDDVYHGRICSDCGEHDLREHIGGTATCTDPKICEECGGKYGTVDNSGLSGHPNPTIRFKHVTCLNDGFYHIICSEPGCNHPFTEFIIPARGQHLYNHWYILDGEHSASCADCGESKTVDCILYGMASGDETLTVCPVCGDFAETPFSLLTAREEKNLSAGMLMIRMLQEPVPGTLCGFTAAGVFEGEVVPFLGDVTVTVPAAEEAFTIVRVEMVEGTEIRTEIPFTLKDGQAAITINTAGLFLMLPAE